MVVVPLKSRPRVANSDEAAERGERGRMVVVYRWSPAIRRGLDINKLHTEIVNDLKEMLDCHNVLAKTFRMIRDKFQEDRSSNVRLRLIGKRGTNETRYNLPTVSEVAALVVGDFELSRGDIVTEDGYREDIHYNGGDETTQGRKCVSIREYFAYKIQDRKDEVPTILYSRRLFQQFLID
ncbi:hypothetical protein BC332_15857 [Capsicum chinense]|nr:hypothetical protein BC332_15857 [Capsicum chinense]